MQFEMDIDNKMSILQKIPTMKNFYTSILLLLITSNYTFSQTSLSEEAIKNSEYVFEGIVLSLEIIQDNDENYYVSHNIKVLTLLKGNNNIQQNDTINFISILPENWEIMENGEILHLDLQRPKSQIKGIGLALGLKGVFMANFNTMKKSFLSLKPYCNYSNCLYVYKENKTLDENKQRMNISEIVSGFDKTFASKTEFGKYLKSQGIKTQNTSFEKKKDVEDLERIKVNNIQYAKRVKTAKEYQEYLDYRKSNQSVPHEKAIEDITYEIMNESVTGTGTQFYEFDIYVKGSTSNTYFDNSAFVIEFNTFAFGVNLSSNNMVTITRGINYDNATYVDPMASVTDDSPNSIRFGIGSDYAATSWNRTLLTPISEKLLHVKLQLIDCIGFTDITFIDIANTSIVALYTDTPDIDPFIAPYLAYDNAEYIQPLPYELCGPPAINSFFPSSITAGTKSVLTISGSGFGNVRGNGQVHFSNANDGGNTFLSFLNDYDYISWTDTEIQLILPSIIHDPSSSTTYYYPGSGFFRVERDDNVITTSNSSLEIRYSVNNIGVGMLGTPNFRKLPYRHVDQSISNGGYAREFSLDTSITNYPVRTMIIRKALRDWSCATTIKWIANDTVTQQGQMTDGKSIIYMAGSPNNTELASTVSRSGYSCIDANTNEEIIYFEETDIRIVSDLNPPEGWFYDTTMLIDVPADTFDFYAVITHELGHAHYLSHVVKADETMHYSESPGISASLRSHLYSSPNTIEGGTYVSNKSQNLNTANCSGIGVTSPLYYSSCGVLSVPNSTLNLNSVLVYPNPFNDEITLTFDLNTDANFSYIVTDLYGKLISEKSINSLSNGNYTEVIELPLLSSGVYFITINFNNERKAIKIIKQ